MEKHVICFRCNDDDDDDVFIFTCAPVLGHMTHGEIYIQVGVSRRVYGVRGWCVMLASGTSNGGARLWVVGGCVFV
jgi:hypothetical protein